MSGAGTARHRGDARVLDVDGQRSECQHGREVMTSSTVNVGRRSAPEPPKWSVFSPSADCTMPSRTIANLRRRSCRRSSSRQSRRRSVAPSAVSSTSSAGRPCCIRAGPDRSDLVVAQHGRPGPFPREVAGPASTARRSRRLGTATNVDATRADRRGRATALRIQPSREWSTEKRVRLDVSVMLASRRDIQALGGSSWASRLPQGLRDGLTA